MSNAEKRMKIIITIITEAEIQLEEYTIHNILHYTNILITLYNSTQYISMLILCNATHYTNIY